MIKLNGLSRKFLSILMAIFTLMPILSIDFTANAAIDANSYVPVAEGKELVACFPDYNFAKYVYDVILKKGNGNFDKANGQKYKLTSADIDLIKNREAICVYYKGISSLCGVENFESLKEIDCSANKLKSLPDFPESVTRIDCSWNSLVNLPKLPKNLKSLKCSENKLVDLSASLPEGLEVLECQSNALTSLSKLPQSLTYLDCSYNQLVSLPALPGALKELHCDINKLESLPELPCSLTYLNCGSNNLSSLPQTLPSELKTLTCYGNKLNTLPDLPSKLEGLCCSQNNLTTLPQLPQSLIGLDCSYNQITSLPQLPDGLCGLYVIGNKIEDLDLSNLKNLGGLNVGNNKLKKLNVPEGIKLDEFYALDECPEFTYSRTQDGRYKIMGLPADNAKLTNLKINGSASGFVYNELDGSVIVGVKPTNLSYKYDTGATYYNEAACLEIYTTNIYELY